MGLLLSRAHSHDENNSLQSAFYTDHARFAWWVWSPLGHMKQSCSIKAMYNLAFPVFMSPVVWNMCENLHYESVHFKELHNDQEHYWPTIYRAGAAVWCQLLLVFIHNGEKLLYTPDLKMVLIFLVTKVFQKGTMVKWLYVSLSHEILGDVILGDPGAVSREHFIDSTNCPWVSEDGAPSIYQEIPEIPVGMLMEHTFFVRCNEKLPGISGILKT